MHNYSGSIIALLAVFITGYSALVQIRINNITNARLKWLENLKGLISEYFSASLNLYLKNSLAKTSSQVTKEQIANSNLTPESHSNLKIKLAMDVQECLSTVESKFDQIKLNLNPFEILHFNLEEMLDSHLLLTNRIAMSDTDFRELNKKIYDHTVAVIDLSRLIMKLEWEKTKRGRLCFNLWYMPFGKGNQIKKKALSIKIKLESKEEYDRDVEKMTLNND